jgi:HEAT repeat protein
VQALATVYPRESSARVRNEIVKTFALVANSDPMIVDVVESALSDSNPATVQYAAMAVARLRVVHLLPRIVELFRHPDRVARIAAAQAMVRLAPESRRYLTDRTNAAAVETDDITRKTMIGSIQAIERR